MENNLHQEESSRVRRPQSAALHDATETLISRSPPPPAPLRHSYAPVLTKSPIDAASASDVYSYSFGRDSDRLTLETSLQMAVNELAAVAAELGNSDHHSPQPLVWTDDRNTWQQRCLQLEISLQRLSQQNMKIRDVLQQKLVELEHRTIESEHRAEHAEENARLLEQRLATVSLNASSGSQQLDALRSSVQQRESAINQLQSQVDQQKMIRLNEAKHVEAKAAKIKEWVNNKLKDLEDQNRYLREQNRRCNEQMELLKCRLDQLSEYRLKQRVSIEDSSRGSLEDRPESDSCLPMCDHGRGGTIYLSTSTDKSYVPPISLDVTTQKSRQQPTLSVECPPPISLERKQFRNARLSSTSLARSSCTSQADSGSVDMETLHEITPLSPPTLTTRQTLAGMPSMAAESNTLSSYRNHGQVNSAGQCNSVASSSATLPPSGDRSRSHKTVNGDFKAKTPVVSTDAPRKTTSVPSATSSDQHCRMIDEDNDYNEIYTPTDDWPSPVNFRAAQSNPPTPPQHRITPLESKLYQMAAKGMVTSSANTLSTAWSDPTKSSSRCCFFDDAVPVFASVQGHASQIGWSASVDALSESSDGEDCLSNRSGQTEAVTTGSDDVAGQVSSSASRTLSRHRQVRRSSSDRSGKNRISPTKLSSATAGGSARASSDQRDSVSNNDTAATFSRFDKRDGQVNNIKCLEKSGYLTKLGGKLKTWRKRWFVVKDNRLMYWKSQHEVSRKAPQWQTVLDDRCQVHCELGSHTFSVTTEHKVLYLSSDSQSTVHDWVRMLQNILRRSAVHLLLSGRLNSATIQGWLTRVKNGHSRRLWCMLVGKMLLYLRSPDCTNVSGQLNLRDCEVHETSQSSDTDEDTDSSSHSTSLTIGLFPSLQTPTYLVASNKNEKDSWLYHLTVMSRGSGTSGTQFEQLLTNLMEANGAPQSLLWKDPLLLPCKEPPTTPLTTIPENLRAEAAQLFKSCHLFASVMIDPSAIDYHVALAQDVLNVGCTCRQLQDELLAVLIKQTAHRAPRKHVAMQNLLLCATQSLFLCDSRGDKPNSPPALPTGSTPLAAGQQVDGAAAASGVELDDEKEELGRDRSLPYVLLQSWQLLALAVSLFVPRNTRLLWLLKLHLQRHHDLSTETGKYAAYCQRALDRTLRSGGRQARPSRMEVLSIFLKNPQHHSLPHAIPVHLTTGAYQVIGFDGSTSVCEFVRSLNEELGCRDVEQSGFALFSDDPIQSDVQHALPSDLKLCDVISRWEVALREKRHGRTDLTRLIRLSYRCRLYWRRHQAGMPDREQLLHVHHTSQRINAGLFPLSRELAIELAVLLAQIEYGDFNNNRQGKSTTGNILTATLATPGGHSAVLANKCLQRFYPTRYMTNVSPNDEILLVECVSQKWAGLRGRSAVECARIYLNTVRQWPHFNATLFRAMSCENPSRHVVLSVSENAISVLEADTLLEKLRFSYNSVLTFGGSQQDFMLVVSKPLSSGACTSTKYLFRLAKHQIVELTLLMADYMNSLGEARQAVVAPDLVAQVRADKPAAARTNVSVSSLQTASAEKSAAEVSLI